MHDLNPTELKALKKILQSTKQKQGKKSKETHSKVRIMTKTELMFLVVIITFLYFIMH